MLSQLIKSISPELTKTLQETLTKGTQKALSSELTSLFERIYSTGDFPIQNHRQLTGSTIKNMDKIVDIINSAMAGNVQGGNPGEMDSREDKIKRLQEALKASPGTFQNMPSSFDEAVKWMNDNLPLGQNVNGKIVKGGAKMVAMIRSLATILNRSVGARIQLAADRPIDEIARDVAIVFKSLTAEYCADFIGYYAALTYALEKAKIYNLVLKALIAETDKIGQDDVHKLANLKVSFNMVHEQLSQYLNSMGSILRSDDIVTRLDNIYKNPGKGIDLLMQINTITSQDNDAVAKEVMRNMGRISELFRLASAVQMIKKTTDPHLKALLDSFASSDMANLNKALSDISMEGKTSTITLESGEVMSLSQLGRILVSTYGKTDPSERRKIIEDPTNTAYLNISGQAEMTIQQNIQTSIDVAHKTQIELKRRAIGGINTHMKGIIQIIKSICGGLQSGEIRVTPDVKFFYETTMGLKDLRKTGTFQAVSGIHFDARFQQARNTFFDTLDRIKAACDKLSSISPLFNSCGTAIANFQRYMDTSATRYKEVTPQRYGAPFIAGNAELDVDVMPQLNTVLVAFENIMYELSYSINFHRGLQRMKTSGQALNDVSGNIQKVRTEAVAEKVKELQDVRDTDIAALKHANQDSLFTMKYGAAMPAAGVVERDEMRNKAINMTKDMYNTQIILLQTAEAIDTILDKYIRNIALDPTLMKELYREIKDNPGIASWFNEKSGDTLIEFFESFPINMSVHGDPIIKTKFVMSGTLEHYYEQCLAPYAGEIREGSHAKNVAEDAVAQAAYAATVPLGFNNLLYVKTNNSHGVSLSKLGLHLYPLYPSDYEHMKKKAMFVAQSTGALKNLLATFFHIARKIGGEEMMAFMSPATIYKNLCEYIAVSSLSRGIVHRNAAIFPRGDSAALYAGGNTIINQDIKIELNAELTAHTSDYFDVVVSHNNPSAGAIHLPGGGGVYAPILMRSNMNIGVDLPIAPYTDVGVGAMPHTSKTGVLALTGVIAASIYPHDAATGRVYPLQFMRETDLIFSQIIQSMYAKLMTSIECYTALYRPISVDRYHHLRSIIGGDENVVIDPEYIELYFTMIALSEFYNKIFGFRSASNASGVNIDTARRSTINNLVMFIGIMPESTSKYANFVRCGFINQEDSNAGNYSQKQVRDMIVEINNLIASESGIPDDRTHTLIDGYIRDVNTRYGLMAMEDAEAYSGLIKEQMATRGVYDDIVKDTSRSDAISILPGEDALFSEWDGPAPSDALLAPRDNDRDVFGEYKLKRRAKAKIQDVYRTVIHGFRTQIDNIIDQNRNTSEEDLKNLTTLLNDTKVRVAHQTNQTERFLETYRLVTIGHSDNTTNISELMIEQEYRGLIDLLRELACQVLTATEIARICSSMDNIKAELSRAIKTSNQDTDTTLAALARTPQSLLNKFISFNGVSDADDLAVYLGSIAAVNDTNGPVGAPRSNHILTNHAYGGLTCFGAGGNIPAGGNVGIPQLVSGLVAMLASNTSYDVKISEMLIDAIMDYDIMFSSMINICTTLSNNDVGEDKRLIDVQITNGQFAFNFSKLQEAVGALCNSIDSIRKVMPTTPTFDDDGLSYDRLYEVFNHYLFSDATSPNYQFSLHNLGRNMTNMFKLLNESRKVNITSNKDEFFSDNTIDFMNWVAFDDAVGGNVVNVNAMVNAPYNLPRNVARKVQLLGGHYVPATPAVHNSPNHNNTGCLQSVAGADVRLICYVPQSATNSRVKYEYVLRTLLYFNAHLPNSGLPYNVKELRAEYPIYGASASSSIKGVPLMQWRQELGFPDMLKMPGNIDEYRSHSLMIDLNAFIFNLINDCYDLGTNKIYAKILNVIMPTINSSGNLLATYPDTYPNVLALTTHANEAGAQMQVWSSYFPTASNNIFGTAASPAPMAYTRAQCELIYSTNFRGLAGNNSTATYTDPKAGFNVSLEQFILAGELFSSSDAADYTAFNMTAAIPYTAAGTLCSANSQFAGHLRVIQAFMIGITNVDGLDGTDGGAILRKIATASHGFIRNVYQRVPDKVPYRSYSPISNIGFGIRRDPKPDNPLFASVVHLILQLMNNRPDKGELVNLFPNLEDVPEHCKDVMKTKLPYYISLFKNLSQRAQVISRICSSINSIPNTELTPNSYSKFDICDIELRRTDVWGSQFKNNTIIFATRINDICKQISSGLTETYLSLNDTYVYSEPSDSFKSMFASNNGRPPLTPLHMSLIMTRFGTPILPTSIAGTYDITDYKILRGYRGIVNSCVSQGLDPKSYEQFISMFKQYTSKKAYSLTDNDISSIIASYVTLYRYVIGNRMFKVTLQDEVSFKGFGIQYKDILNLSPRALATNANLYDVTIDDHATLNGGGGALLANATPRDLSGLMQSIISIVRAVPVVLNSRASMLFSQVRQPNELKKFTVRPPAVAPGYIAVGVNAESYIDILNEGAYVTNFINRHRMIMKMNYADYARLVTAGEVGASLQKSILGYGQASQNGVIHSVARMNSESILMIPSLTTNYGIKTNTVDVRSNYKHYSVVLRHYGSPYPYTGMVHLVGPAPGDNYATLRAMATVSSSIDGGEVYKMYSDLASGVSATFNDRDVMISALMKKFNIIPININLISRDIPFGALYNSAYNFRNFIIKKMGLNHTDIVDNSVNARSYAAFLASLLVNPYMQITLTDYERSFSALMRGNSGFDIGRPQYLSDQVYNKCLFGSLYGGDVNVNSAGPKALTTNTRDADTSSTMYIAMENMICNGLAAILIENEFKYVERDALLRRLLETKGNLWRDHTVRNVEERKDFIDPVPSKSRLANIAANIETIITSMGEHRTPALLVELASQFISLGAYEKSIENRDMFTTTTIANFINTYMQGVQSAIGINPVTPYSSAKAINVYLAMLHGSHAHCGKAMARAHAAANIVQDKLEGDMQTWVPTIARTNTVAQIDAALVGAFGVTYMNFQTRYMAAYYLHYFGSLLDDFESINIGGVGGNIGSAVANSAVQTAARGPDAIIWPLVPANGSPYCVGTLAAYPVPVELIKAGALASRQLATRPDDGGGWDWNAGTAYAIGNGIFRYLKVLGLFIMATNVHNTTSVGATITAVADPTFYKVIDVNRVIDSYTNRATKNASILANARDNMRYVSHRFIVSPALATRLNNFAILANHFERHGMYLGLTNAYPIYQAIYLAFQMLFALIHDLAVAKLVNLGMIIATISAVGANPVNNPVKSALIRLLNYINDQPDKNLVIVSMVRSFYKVSYLAANAPRMLQQGTAENNHFNMLTDTMHTIISTGIATNYGSHGLTAVLAALWAAGLLRSDTASCITNIDNNNTVALANAAVTPADSYHGDIAAILSRYMNVAPITDACSEIVHPLIFDIDYATGTMLTTAVSADLRTLKADLATAKISGGALPSTLIKKLAKDTVVNPLSAITTNRVLESMMNDSLFFVPTTGFYENTSLGRIAENYGFNASFNDMLLAAVLTTQIQTIYGCYARIDDIAKNQFVYNYASALNMDGFYVKNQKRSADNAAIAVHSFINTAAQKSAATALFPLEDPINGSLYANSAFNANTARYTTLHTIGVNNGVAMTGQFVYDSHSLGYMSTNALITPITNPADADLGNLGFTYSTMDQVLTAYQIPTAKNTIHSHKAIIGHMLNGAAELKELSKLSYYLRCGSKSQTNINHEGLLPIQGAVSLPGIKVDQKFTSQGHGPMYEINKFGSSRAAFGHELQDFVDGAKILNKRLASIASTNRLDDEIGYNATNYANLLSTFYNQICAAYVGMNVDRYDNAVVYQSIKAAIAEFQAHPSAASYDADIVDVLPVANIKTTGIFSDASSNVKSFMYHPATSYKYHNQSCGHLLRDLFIGNTLYIPLIGTPTYTLHKDNPAGHQPNAVLAANNVGEETVTINSVPVNPTLAMYTVMFYHTMRYYLNTFIPSLERVDLILTNTLFSEFRRDNGAPYYIFDNLPESEYDDLFAKMTERMFKFVSNSNVLYKPFDATFYNINQLHNVCFNYGAEGAAAGLSALWYPSLVQAFKTPAVCLPLDISTSMGAPQSIGIAAVDHATRANHIITQINAELNNGTLAKHLYRAGMGSQRPAEEVLKAMPNILSQYFGAQAGLKFNYTRGLHDANTLNINDPLTDGERMQTKKSIMILAQHASFISAVVFAEAKKNAKTATESSQQYYERLIAASQRELQALCTNTTGNSYFFNANYHMPVETLKSDDTPVAQLLNKNKSFPVKMGTSAFTPSTDSFGLYSKTASNYLFNSTGNQDATFTNALPVPIVNTPPLVSVGGGGYNTYPAYAPAKISLGPAISEQIINHYAAAGQHIFNHTSPVYGGAALSTIGNELIHNQYPMNMEIGENDFTLNGFRDNVLPLSVLTVTPVSVCKELYDNPVLNANNVYAGNVAFNANATNYTASTISNMYANVNRVELTPANPVNHLPMSNFTKAAIQKRSYSIPASLNAHITNNIPVGCMEQGLKINYCIDNIKTFTPYLSLYNDTNIAWGPFDVRGMNVAYPERPSYNESFNPVTAAMSPISQLIMELAYTSRRGIGHNRLSLNVYAHMAYLGFSAAYQPDSIFGPSFTHQRQDAAGPAIVNPAIFNSQIAAGHNNILAGCIHPSVIADPHLSTVDLAIDSIPSGAPITYADVSSIYNAAGMILPGPGAPANYQIGTLLTAYKTVNTLAGVEYLNQRLRLHEYRIWKRFDESREIVLTGGRNYAQDLTVNGVNNRSNHGNRLISPYPSAPRTYDQVPIGIFSPAERIAIKDWEYKDVERYKLSIKAWYNSVYLDYTHTYKVSSISELSDHWLPREYYTSTVNNGIGSDHFKYANHLYSMIKNNAALVAIGANAVVRDHSMNFEQTCHDRYCDQVVELTNHYTTLPRLNLGLIPIANFDNRLRDIATNTAGELQTTVTINGRIMLSYLRDGQIQTSQIENEMNSANYRVLGKLRFDTVLVRNLVNIHLIYNIAAKEVLDKLTDLGREPVFGKSSFHPSLTQYPSNQSQPEMQHARQVDRTTWSAVPNF